MATRLTVQLDPDLARRVRPYAGPRGLNRFINQAVAEKLAALERARIEEEMKAGYLAEAVEQQDVIAHWEAVDVEEWPAE
jgi:hypothetical protein